MRAIFGIFVGLALLHFGLYKVLNLPFTISYDHLAYTYTTLQVMRNALLRGEWPLWFSESFTGMPLLFAGSLDLKAILFLKFFSTLDSMVLLFSFFIVFGGVTFCLMVRSLFGFGLWPAIYGGVFWTLNGFVLFWAYDTPFTVTTYWIPPLIWAVLKVGTHPVLASATLLLGFADMIMTGRAESLELSCYAIGSFVAIYTYQQNATWRVGSRQLFIRGLITFVFVAAAIGICFPFLKQQRDLFLDSVRFHAYQGGLTFHQTWINFFNIVPNSELFFWFRDGIGSRAYVGLFNLFLAVMGCFFTGGRRYRPYLIAAVVASLFMYDFQILWVFSLWRDLYKALPNHEGIRYSIRFLPTFFIFFSIPLCYGFSLILEKRDEIFSKIYTQIAAWLCVAFLAGCSLWLIKFIENPIAQMVAVILILNIALFIWAVFYRTQRVAFSVAAIFVSVLSSWFCNLMMQDQPSLSEWNRYSQPVRQEYLKALEGIPRHEYRVAHVGHHLSLVPNFLIANGIHSVSGYHPTIDHKIVEHFASNDEAEVYTSVVIKKITLDRYDAANVRFWFVDPIVKPELKSQLRSQGAALRQTFSDGMELYESPTAASRVSFEGGEAKILDYKNSYVKIEAKSEKGGLLILRDHFDKRWRVSIDGEAASIEEVEALFRGVRLPPGLHKIEFFFSVI